MTYPDDDTTHDDDMQGIPENFRERMRSLERDAKAHRSSSEENAKLQRELAFTKAGINTDDPKLGYFAKGYDGEVTAEAIRAAAESAGFLSATPDATADKADLEAYDRVSQASAGTASRTSDEDRRAALDQAAAQGREPLLAELERQGMRVVRN